MGESSELFVNCLEAMVETCLPVEESNSSNPPPKAHNLSCSLSSLTLNSPTDKGKTNASLAIFQFLFIGDIFSAFSTESLDGHEGFRGSVSSLRRGSCGKPRSASAKHRLSESPIQSMK